MGDRGNICVRQEQGDVWFYGHWSGCRRHEAVQEALAKNWRWTDESYLARIIWDCWCPRRNHGAETSYGISTHSQDNEYPVLVVDIPQQIVYEILEERLDKDGTMPKGYKPESHWTFEDFASLHKPEAAEKA